MKTNNQQGFTIIEVLISLGIFVILAFTLALFQTQMSVSLNKLETRIDNSVDTNLAERIIFRDLNNIDPSFNNLMIKDDNNKSFFDYYPDVSEKLLPPTELSRNFTMKLGQSTEFYLIAQDISAGPLLIYDPVAAYTVGPNLPDFNKPSSLFFVSLNNNNWIGKKTNMYWKTNNLLMLDTPVRLRPLDDKLAIDMTIAPRSPIFIGAVTDQTKKTPLEQFAFPKGLNVKIKDTDPLTASVLSSEDLFLRLLPPMGGGIPLVRLRSVKIYRYSLVKYTDNRLSSAPARLFRAVYEKGKWTAPFMIADRVAELQISRDSVLKKIVSFKLLKVDLKQK